MKAFSIVDFWKLVRPHVVVVLLFLVLAMVYFAPALDGKEIHQGDVEKFMGMSQELREYYQKEGKSSAWTGSMFSGMPAYTIGVWGGTVNLLDVVERPFKALGSKDIGVVFMAMLCCYLLLLLMGAKIPVAVLGAIAFSFSSYSIIILEAGHITKAWAMAYMPLVFAGFWLVLKRNYLWGGSLFAFALALQIKSNHVQITYYLTLFCFIVFVGYALSYLRERAWRPLVCTFSTLFVAVVLAALCNLGNLYANYESSHESIRGKSELSHAVDGKTDKSGGLDKDYAFAWSYGVGETFTLLIPDFYGGASGGTLDRDSHLAKAMQAQGFQAPSPLRTATYWGDQPFTSGPVYFGAIVCFLFVLALWLVRNPLKWWIFGAVVFFICLSWGRNFDSFNTFLFHYLPYYNKFRTVSMALVVPQLAFVILAVWGLVEIFQKGISWEKLRRPLLYSLYITGGVCLLFMVLTPFDFSSASDAHLGVPDWYLNALREDRAGLMRADALRSLFFVLAAAACIYGFVKNRESKMAKYLPWTLVFFVLLDLWLVDRRYLNKDNFVAKNTYTQVYRATPADKIILKDPDLSYRVLSLNNPFNESHIPYFHKSIGGYSAAKLRRYQELIDLKIMPEIQAVGQSFKSGRLESIQESFKSAPVLDMLNMRYLVFDPSQAPVVNPYAYGNAWFVKEVRMVENADEEMSVAGTGGKDIAWVDQRFADVIREKSLKTDSLAEVVLTAYKPNSLEYVYRSEEPGVLVFSEVYYPHGWKAFVDGKPVPHFRTNWILRGMEVPAGEHRVEFRFEPDAYFTARIISTVTSAILLLVFAGLLARGLGWGKWS